MGPLWPLRNIKVALYESHDRSIDPGATTRVLYVRPSSALICRRPLQSQTDEARAGAPGRGFRRFGIHKRDPLSSVQHDRVPITETRDDQFARY